MQIFWIMIYRSGTVSIVWLPLNKDTEARIFANSGQKKYWISIETRSRNCWSLLIILDKITELENECYRVQISSHNP